MPHRIPFIRRSDRWRRYGTFVALMAVRCLCVQTISAQRALPDLTATQDLRIDASVNDLAPVGWILPLRNGEIAVGQHEDHMVRFFGANGRPTGSFGRLGSGPGEFRVVGLAGMIGDTVWVGDGPNARTTYIGPDHQLVRVEPMVLNIKATAGDEQGLPATSSAGILLLGRYANGSFLTEARVPLGMMRPQWYPIAANAAAWVRVSATGVFEKVIAVRGPSPPSCQVSGTLGGSLRFSAWVPFCDQSQQFVAQDGSRIAFVLGNGITGSNDRYRVLVIATTGDTVFARDYRYRLLPIPARVVDSVRAYYAGRPNTPPDAANTYRHMTLPPSYSPVLRLLVGLDGRVWLEEPSNSAGHHWRILDARGEPVATTMFPASMKLLAADQHHAWGTDTDADGLQSVVRYSLKQ